MWPAPGTQILDAQSRCGRVYRDGLNDATLRRRVTILNRITRVKLDRQADNVVSLYTFVAA